MRTRCCRPPWGCPRLSCNPKTGNTKAWQGAASCGLAPALPPSPACIANQLTGNLLLHADSLLSPSLGLPPATLRMALPRAFLGWLRRAVSGGESWGPGEGSPKGGGEWGQGGARASGKRGGVMFVPSTLSSKFCAPPATTCQARALASVHKQCRYTATNCICAACEGSWCTLQTACRKLPRDPSQAAHMCFLA